MLFLLTVLGGIFLKGFREAINLAVWLVANIRSIATVLDVSTLIRSKAGGSQEPGPDPETNRFMN